LENSQDIRKAIEAKWNEYLAKYGNLFSSDSLSGSSPPSVFVGSYNYPKVNVGPMVPPIHGDTGILDAPERWIGKSLEEIVNYRLNLVRGIQKVPVNDPTGRYIENLQELAMSEEATDSDKNIRFSTVCNMAGNMEVSAHRDGVENYLTTDETQESLKDAAKAWIHSRTPHFKLSCVSSVVR